MIFREAIEIVGGQRFRLRNPHQVSLVLGLALLLGWAAEARAQDEFALRLLPGPRGSGAESINKKGQIVGDNSDLPAFWEGPDATTLTVLPVPPGPFGSFGAANSINDKGQIVGSFVGRDIAFLPLPAFWESPDATTLTVLPVPGSFGSFGAANSINDKGQIVGFVGQAGPLPAFWAGPDATVPTILPVPSGPFSPSGFAASINRKGQIVGSAGLLPAVWEGPDAAPTFLPVPAGPFTPSGSATSINEKGQIVGTVVGQIGDVTANLPTFWEGPDATAPTFLPLPPEAVAGFARSINGKGQIVGAGVQPGLAFGSPHPVSVPAFWEGPDATAPTFLPFPPEAVAGFARSINDKGQIVGRAGFAGAIWAEERTEGSQE